MQAALFVILLAWFCLPGYLLSGVLRRNRARWFATITDGFVFSMALFALIAWPCLWFRLDAEVCWSIVGLVWLALPVALLLWNRRRDVDSTAIGSADASKSRIMEQAPSVATRWMSLFLLVDCLALCGAVATSLAGQLNPLLSLPSAGLTLLAGCFFAGLLLLPTFRTIAPHESRQLGMASAPRLWTSAAVLVVLALSAGAALAARPDWDDSWYLAAVHRYSEGRQLNREGFSLRGEDVVPPHTRLLSWELFGATLCRFSGLHPMVSHHTLLPPFFVTLAATIHWRLFSLRLLSPRLAPLAVIGLCGYWLFGVSSYDSPGSYLLTRAWQGKTMLWTLGLPLLVDSLWEFQEHPAARTWVSCLLASLGALAMSSSAVYLVFALVPLFCAAMNLFGRVRLNVRHCAAMFTVTLPAVVYGLLVRGAAVGYTALSHKPEGSSWLQSLHWGCIEYGSAEILWFALLPLLAALLPTRQARAYSIGLPVLLLATFLNPCFYELVALHLTSYQTYFRLFWLIPFGLGLGVVSASTSACLAEQIFPRLRRCATATALFCAIALGLSFPLLPGRCAWSCRNEGPFHGLCFAWGENAYKIPSELLRIVKRVCHDAERSSGRLLLPEHLAQFFVPYTSGLRYVVSRPTYTAEALSALGRSPEGLERVMLVNRLLGTTGTEYLVRYPDRSPLADAEAKRLVAKYEVWGIVVDVCPPRLRRQLAWCGFDCAYSDGPYEYWRLDRSANEAGE